LNIAINGGSFIAINKDVDTVLCCWGSGGTAETSEEVRIPLYEHPFSTNLINRIKSAPGFFTEEYTQKEKKDFFTFLFKHEPWSKLDAKQKDETLSSPGGYTRSCYVSQHTSIFIINHFGKKFSAADNDILQRFGKVFEQAYTRFLDLQKAEAQAREAQIEAALERVRSKTMAMQRSEELDSVIKSVYSELKHLDVSFDRCFIMIFDEQKGATWWMGSPEDDLFHEGFYVQYHTHQPHLAYLKGWEGRQQKWEYWLGGQIKKDWDEFIFNKTELSKLPPIAIQYMKSFDSAHLAASFENFGCMTTGGQEKLSEESFSILSRFAKVFDQTYTRFNDLKQAEAQAREAKIEAALERVRAKAMAMHKSEDLNPAVATVFEELDKLNIGILRCGIAIMDKEKPRGDVWITVKSEQSNTIQVSGDESLDYHPLLLGAYKGWVKQEDFSYVLQEDDLINYYRDVASMKYQLPVSTSFDTEKKDQQQYYYNAVFQDGSLFAFMETAITDEAKTVMKRFANVFNLTYKRFLDLQKAEAQTREAKIEAALERVRARALAMQEPEELIDVAQVLRTEMGLLGVEELETCSIYINDETTNKTEFWYALKDLRVEEKKLVSDHFPLNLNDTWVGREMKNFYGSDAKQVSIVMQGANRKEWINYCEEKSVPFRGYYGEVIPDRTYHLYKFSHGAIGAAAAGDISAESWKLLSRAASVFSLAYSRFKDLTQARNDLIKLKEEKKRAEDALTDLQVTQKQLVQAEKMASLGELTAGIAHEIQNPLNFVNNFSDVSNELLDEMKVELEKGNAEEAKLIAVNVKENLEKILHHGKRADAIVKGMLQHSRTNTGQKEPTDINVLAEEYLRLAYHGLRAKDKFFNAKFETDLDRSITKINIVPQEIGRVILNLINNSFYAVNEKKRTVSNGYEPSVTVSTKKLNDKVEIRVVDNGNGIPQKVLDKIFQPFFTTKPTGQGTGLGLSLSYDIVTKGHDGEIKVETKEGEGSAFTISLPMK
jgi:signal transduction histidine kinase